MGASFVTLQQNTINGNFTTTVCKPYFPLLLYQFNSIPILIQVYPPPLPHKRGWPDLLYSGSNLSNSHSPSHSIQCILFLQTNIPSPLAFSMSSSLPLSLHFKLYLLVNQILKIVYF